MPPLLQDSTYELIRGLANLSSAVEVDPLYFDQLLGAAVNVKHAFDLGRMDVINGTIRPRNTSLCHECITTVSSVWRSGPEGPRTLCNACGLRYYKQNQRRTVEAKRRESKDVADAAASLAALGSVSMKAVESLIAKNDFATSCNKRKRSIVSGSNEYSDDDDENDDDDDEVYDDDDENDDEEDDGYIGTQRKVASDKGGGSRHEDKSFRGETGLAGAASPQHSPGVVTLPSIANICDRMQTPPPPCPRFQQQQRVQLPPMPFMPCHTVGAASSVLLPVHGTSQRNSTFQQPHFAPLPLHVPVTSIATRLPLDHAPRHYHQPVNLSNGNSNGNNRQDHIHYRQRRLQ
ncbi:hypothetical protein H4R26_000867 [Coemansia thaxteri]|uniref:GATA-type domain-containing protein n=1 Tax=Coemansia thaxteri TaxID=2663907 RepID=A0A9W8ELP5_9FUNG|nr:hypothetical protein H4R26_000867 [Coemansia thaxteri]